MISYRGDQRQIFQSEIGMLLDAKKEALLDKHQGNELLIEYQKLLTGYEKLLRVTKKILYISDLQGVALKKCEEEMKTLLDHVNQGFMTVDSNLIVQKQFSAACQCMLGRKPSGIPLAELLWEPGSEESQRVTELLNRVFAEKSEQDRQTLLNELPAMVIRQERHLHLEYKLINQDDEVPQAAEQVAIMVMMTDLTEELESKAKADYLSFHDSLTGLYNRAYMEMALPEMMREACMPISVVLLDMNGLKLANDVFGHHLGDQLLNQAASLIRQCFGEQAMVARWGGDEFLALLPGTDASECAEKIKRLNHECRTHDSFPIHISLAIGKATLHQQSDNFHFIFNLAEKEMYKNKLIESKQVRRSLMSNISEAMYARGVENVEHIERVRRLALELAERIGIAPHSAQMHVLKQLVQLHDVGKIIIPDHILSKRESLSNEDWEIIRTHSETGYRMAISLGEPALAEAILSMHERWDGKGYPYGLKETQIPRLSRLLAVVDAYDVMTHDQTYRKAKQKDEALHEIAAASGVQFDPEIVTAFTAFIRETERLSRL